MCAQTLQGSLTRYLLWMREKSGRKWGGAGAEYRAKRERGKKRAEVRRDDHDHDCDSEGRDHDLL